MARQPGTYAIFDTTEGKIVCRLFEKEAPITTKNFTDLAEGKRSWKDSVSGKRRRWPALQRHNFSPRDSGLYDPGRRSQRHGHGRSGL